MPIAAHENWHRAKGEEGVIGRFDYMEVLDPAASEAAGEIKNKMIPVLIAKTHLSPDYNPQKVPTDPIARKAMIDRFPEAWLEFQGQMVEVPGTPLTENFHELTMTRGEIAKYNLNSITTWEQIAELSDAGCLHVGFGTVRRREEVMYAMGRTPPGKPPNVQLSAGMTAEEALRAMPGGNELADKLNRVIAEKNGEAVPENAAAPTGAVDLSSPEVQAAIAAAVQTALAAHAPKPRGWPAGKPRGQRKAKAAEPATDAPVPKA